jgi:hypothetical protein
MSDTDFAGALQRFKDAALALDRAWNPADGEVFGATYPGYLPSFDQFVVDVLGMEAEERDPVKRTVVVIYNGAVRDDVADARLERALEDLPFVADVEVHYEDMIEKGEH